MKTLQTLGFLKTTWKTRQRPRSEYGFSGGSDGKESTCNAEDLHSIPESGRFPEGGHGNPLQYACLENPHGQRILVGYSPWGHKESDITEQLSTAQHSTAQDHNSSRKRKYKFLLDV